MRSSVLRNLAEVPKKTKTWEQNQVFELQWVPFFTSFGKRGNQADGSVESRTKRTALSVQNTGRVAEDYMLFRCFLSPVESIVYKTRDLIKRGNPDNEIKAKLLK